MASNSPKQRDFFITINKGAKCYETALEIVKELNYRLYAYIVHDKDELINPETGEKTPKPEHIHIMMELMNPVSFNRMQQRFEGAHIIVPKYKKSAYQYLIHNSPRSRTEKYQYPLTDIITNDTASVKLIVETEQSELFHEGQFLVYIAEGTRTPYQFVKRFGLNAYKQFWKPYEDMLKQLNNDMEMQNDLQELLHAGWNDDLPF